MKLAISVGRQNPSAPFGAVIIDFDSDAELARGVNRAQRLVAERALESQSELRLLYGLISEALSKQAGMTGR